MSRSVIEPAEEAINRALIDRYQHAWATSDVEAIISMTAPDGVYEASYGPHPWGDRFVGPDAIREGITAMHAASTHRSSTHDYDETYVYGNRAFATWISRYVDVDGRDGAVQGCDFYEFRDGLVTKKLAYRKTVTG